MEKGIPCCHQSKAVGAPMLISHSLNFGAKKVIKDKEGYYIMTKGSIVQEYVAILNVYVPNYI